jgi:hypothetical protein
MKEENGTVLEDPSYRITLHMEDPGKECVDGSLKFVEIVIGIPSIYQHWTRYCHEARHL